MRIAKEGKYIIFPLFVFCIFAFIISWYYVYSFFLFSVLSFALVFCLVFFRDPIRTVPEEKNIIVSPADGKITKIINIIDADIGEATLISIFLNVYNVHVNRMPTIGVVSQASQVEDAALL